MPDFNVPPVLFLVYARPGSTRLVFEEIRKVRPGRLYIAADGPKAGSPEIAENCELVREIVTRIDWDCQVFTLLREQNLGCKIAVSEAINWFFEKEEEGIILEDDCLPNRHFFEFCEKMLERYRSDQRIMHIAGTNLQFGRKRGDASYYFSNITMVWGWAGWRRSWRFYDLHMRLFPEFRQSGMMRNILPDERIASHLMNVLQSTYEGKTNTWDHQYGFSLAINNGICITPNVNLISNLGYGKDDDPQASDPYMLSKIPRLEMEEPFVHPEFFIPDKEADLLQVSWNVFDTKEEGRKKLEKLVFMNYEER